MQQSVRRLIEGFVPSHYDLHITQNSDDLTFFGTVHIQGTRGTGPLTFHASELSIGSALINGSDTAYTLNESLQELELTDDSSPGSILDVEVSFSGVITRPMHGLYPCYFEGENGNECILATQLESHHAREVFPCIDEPEAKATFQLHLTVPEHDVAISNTPIESRGERREVQDNFLVTTTFETTPKMSTYLLAWVSGNLIYDEVSSAHGVQIRAYSTPVHKGKADFALSVASQALDYMDDYFDVPYPLKKYDIVALPDFAAAGMENWGLVTYREGSMLIDEAVSDLADKQHVANVTVHEAVHQWFGNLVTMRWWDDLWLNEGFASFMPYIVTDELFPEWHIWEQFATDDLALGLSADALYNSHPIVVDIHSPEEIRSAFDSISYDKGCSVINLVYRYIGKAAFRDGLRNYLKEHAYGNAETKDLWQAWSATSGKDVLAFMRTWTEVPGFPLVTASSSGDTLTLAQTRFFLDPDHPHDNTQWTIPLMRSDQDEELLEQTTEHYNSPSKLNLGQSGFYRVIYQGELKEKIQDELRANNLSPMDTLGIISDASEAAKAGHHSTTEALELMRYVGTSTNETLLGGVLSQIAEYRTIFSEQHESLKPFVRELIRPNLERLGIELSNTDTIDDQLLRPMILSSAVYCDDSRVTSWAVNEFARASQPDDLRPDARMTIYQAAIKNSPSLETYEKLLHWYFDTTIPGEQLALAGALCGLDNTELLERSLGLVSENEVKLQDARFWIAYGLRNRTQRHVAWEWLKRNWQWIGDNYGQEKELDYFLRYASTGFASEEHLRDYSEFYKSSNLYGSERAFEQGKETIRWQAAWKTRDSHTISEWLKK